MSKYLTRISNEVRFCFRCYRKFKIMRAPETGKSLNYIYMLRKIAEQCYYNISKVQADVDNVIYFDELALSSRKLIESANELYFEKNFDYYNLKLSPIEVKNILSVINSVKHFESVRISNSDVDSWIEATYYLFD